MIKTFTQEDLIQYIYHEAPESLQEQITQAICFDEELAQQCSDLLHTKQAVDQVTRTPGTGAIASILLYSRNYKRQS